MATIRKRGKYQWQAIIRKKGTNVTKTFCSKPDAQKWAMKIEEGIASGDYAGRTDAEVTTLKQGLERYLKEITPNKKGANQEQRKIARMIKCHPTLVSKSLISIRGSDIARYRDLRLGQGRKPATVLQDLALISHLFNIARREWGMGQLINPVDCITKPKIRNQRSRRLAPEEEERLLKAAGEYANPYLQPLIRFAVATAMRRGEILNIRWQDVDLQSRTITLRDTKNGEQRIVPLIADAMSVIKALPQGIKPTHFLFPLSDNLVSIAFRKIRKKVDLEDLHFHDLRHEATSRLFELGLNPMEAAAITGHKTLQMLKRYTHLKAEDLLKKLEGNG